MSISMIQETYLNKQAASCVTVYFLLKQDYEVVDGGDNAAWEKEIEDMLEAEE